MKRGPPDAIGAPTRAGRHGDVVEVVAADLIRGHGAAAGDLDVSELAQLGEAVVDYPDPRGQARQASLERDPAAELARRGLGQDDFITTLPERDRRLQSGRACPHDE